MRMFKLKPPCAEGCVDNWRDVFSIDDKSIIYYCWSHHNIVRETHTSNFAEGVEGRHRIGGWGSELDHWLGDVRKMVREM